jgi:hypothetical protein
VGADASEDDMEEQFESLVALFTPNESSERWAPLAVSMETKPSIEKEKVHRAKSGNVREGEEKARAHREEMKARARVLVDGKSTTLRSDPA